LSGESSLATHIESHSNLIIAEVLDIIEILTDADLALYNAENQCIAESHNLPYYLSSPGFIP
jgi:hypothetical protein